MNIRSCLAQTINDFYGSDQVCSYFTFQFVFTKYVFGFRNYDGH